MCRIYFQDILNCGMAKDECNWLPVAIECNLISRELSDSYLHKCFNNFRLMAVKSFPPHDVRCGHQAWSGLCLWAEASRGHMQVEEWERCAIHYSPSLTEELAPNSGSSTSLGPRVRMTSTLDPPLWPSMRSKQKHKQHCVSKPLNCFTASMMSRVLKTLQSCGNSKGGLK